MMLSAEVTRPCRALCAERCSPFKCGLRFLRCMEERVSGSFPGRAGRRGLRNPSRCSWAEACWRPAPAGLEDGRLCSAEPRYPGRAGTAHDYGGGRAPAPGEAESAPRYRGGRGAPRGPRETGGVTLRGGGGRAPHVTGGRGRPTLPGVPGGRRAPRYRERAQRRALRAASLEPGAGALTAVCCPRWPQSDNVYEWRSTILGPPGSVYEGERVLPRYHLHTEYPFKPPKVRCSPIDAEVQIFL